MISVGLASWPSIHAAKTLTLWFSLLVLFGVRSSHVLPWSFCQKCRQQVTDKHPQTYQNPVTSGLIFDPTSWSGLTLLSRHSVRTYQRNTLTCNWSGNAHPQSSQLTELLWSDPGFKEWNLCDSWSPLKKRSKKSSGGEFMNLPPNNPFMWLEKNEATTIKWSGSYCPACVDYGQHVWPLTRCCWKGAVVWE